MRTTALWDVSNSTLPARLSAQPQSYRREPAQAPLLFPTASGDSTPAKCFARVTPERAGQLDRCGGKRWDVCLFTSGMRKLLQGSDLIRLACVAVVVVLAFFVIRPSKSFLGDTTYKMAFAEREGLLPSIALLSQPFLILWGLLFRPGFSGRSDDR